MQSIKFVLVAALAVFATQCRAAEFPISADKVDLRLFVENGAAIARIIFKAVNTGLDQSKPYSDKILNELAPEARNLIRKAIDQSRAKINEEDQRFTHIFSTLSKGLDTLKPIKSCSDKVSPGAKKLALATEKQIVKIVETVQDKYKEDLKNVELGTQKIIKAARTLFDTEVEAIIKCLKPGRKDSSDCLKGEVKKVLGGTTKIVMDSLILAQTAQDTLSPILPEVLSGLLQLLGKVSDDGQALIKVLGDCVAGLK